MPILNQFNLFTSHLPANVSRNDSTAPREAFLCLVLVINIKTSNTWVVRV